MSPISPRICVPNLVAVRRSCRKKRGGTDRQRKLQLYIVDFVSIMFDTMFTDGEHSKYTFYHLVYEAVRLICVLH